MVFRPSAPCGLPRSRRGWVTRMTLRPSGTRGSHIAGTGDPRFGVMRAAGRSVSRGGRRAPRRAPASRARLPFRRGLAHSSGRARPRPPSARKRLVEVGPLSRRTRLPGPRCAASRTAARGIQPAAASGTEMPTLDPRARRRPAPAAVVTTMQGATPENTARDGSTSPLPVTTTWSGGEVFPSAARSCAYIRPARDRCARRSTREAWGGL